jgi:hypothetical protein
VKLIAILLAIPCLAAGPDPPCGPGTHADYAALNETPRIQTWERGDWTPPPCTNWTDSRYTTLVTVAGRLRSDVPLARVGAITSLKGVQYWSTTHQRWQTLITGAFAITALKDGKRRSDFAPAELTSGQRHYFEQEDTLSGKGIYELQVLESTPDRIVYSVRNLTTLRYLMLPVFHPGDVETVYFLDRESKDIWRYYNIAKIGPNANALAAGHVNSAVNRAVAYYRHLAGIETNQNPPAAK